MFTDEEISLIIRALDEMLDADERHMPAYAMQGEAETVERIRRKVRGE